MDENLLTAVKCCACGLVYVCNDEAICEGCRNERTEEQLEEAGFVTNSRAQSPILYADWVLLRRIKDTLFLNGSMSSYKLARKLIYPIREVWRILDANRGTVFEVKDNEWMVIK